MGFILAQPPEGLRQLLEAVRELRGNPLMGEMPPMPWRNDMLGFTAGDYWITYHLGEDSLDVRSVSPIPDLSNFQ